MTTTYCASVTSKRGAVYGYGETAAAAVAAMDQEVQALKAKGVIKRVGALVTICEGRSIPQTDLFQHGASDRAIQMLYSEATLGGANKYFPVKEG